MKLRVIGISILLTVSARLTIAEDTVQSNYFKDGTVHVISSSHQDIGWMDSPEKCIEARDTMVITPALERMKENPDFCFVMEDMLCLMEYLERHPERKEEIRRYTMNGQLEWGATYNQPYESMYSGEALIRQTYFGRKWLKKNLPGCDSRAAWSPDVPGRAMQMPQILAKAGIKYLHMSRHEEGLYRWLSPDGSGVIAFSPGHYHWSGEIFRASMERGDDHTTIIQKTRAFDDVASGLNERLIEREKYYIKHGISPEFAIISSTDFSGPVNLDALFKEWNKAAENGYYGTGRKSFNMPKLCYATGESFLDAVSEGNPDLQTIVGERPNVWLYIHGPTHHRAITAGREAARLLTAAEKFATIDAALSGNFNKYPAGELTKAWSEAIYPDHGWGGFNGHITDRVFRDSMESGRDRACEILGNSLTSIARRVAVKDGSIPVVVFNDLSWRRSDPVEFVVNVEGRENADFRLVDALGRDVAYQIISGREEGMESDEELRILFVATNVPSIGYKTYYLIPDEKPQKTGIVFRSLENAIENRYYRIQLAPGGIKQIYDNSLGKNIFRTDKFMGGELFTMQSEGNGAGEFAEVQQPTMEGFEKLSDYKLNWVCVEDGPVCSTFESARKIKHCSIRQRIIVYHGIKRIDCLVNILGWDGTKSREFRLAFPLNMDEADIAYEVPMGVVEAGKSEIKGAAGERYVQTCAELRPREVQDWFHASDGTFGVTVSSSVAVFDWVDPTDEPVSYPVLQPVLLASRRSCHGEGNWYLQAGDHSYRFSLYSHEGDWRKGRRLGAQSNRPLRAVVLNEKAESPGLPEEKSFCSVDSKNVVISTIKKCEDDDTVIVRCYEVDGNDTDASVRWFTPVVSAELTNIIEEEGRPIGHKGAAVALKIGHHAIETVKLNTGRRSFKAEDIMPPSTPVFSPAGGIYKESKLKVSLEAEPAGVEIRYTTDGSEPTSESIIYTGPLTLKKNTGLCARVFIPGKSAGRPASAHYRVGLSPAVKVSGIENGLEFEYYEGSWSEVPDFDTKVTVKKGKAESFGLEPSGRGDQFGLRFSGYINVPRNGVYTFYTASDDGSKLYIDEELVVDNDGLHGAIVKEGKIALRKGKHRIVVSFFEQGGDQALDVGYEGPGIERQSIPASVLYRKK